MIALMVMAIAAPSITDRDRVSEVVVVGSRLKNWKGKTNFSSKRVTCKTVHSTGDREVDAIGCASMVHCMTPLYPRAVAAQAKTIDQASRDLTMKLINADLTSCLASQHDQRVEALIERRFQARLTR